MSEKDSWHLREGAPITAELTAMRLLGGGAAYEAYLAFDEVTYGPVVVKVLRPGQVDDPAGLRGLRREVAALAAVNHPVVVRGLRHVVDAASARTWCSSTSTARACRAWSVATDRSRSSSTCRWPSTSPPPLHYFARVGYVHLDIKPSNVIMGSPARLIDLSVMRTVEAAAALTYVIGTDAYLAPEQADPGSARRAGSAERRLGPRRDALPRGGGGAAVRRGRPARHDAGRAAPRR